MIINIYMLISMCVCVCVGTIVHVGSRLASLGSFSQKYQSHTDKRP